MKFNIKDISKKITPQVFGLITIILLVIFGGFLYWGLRVQSAFVADKFKEFAAKIQASEDKLLSAVKENAQLKNSLVAEQQRNNDFENQISSITSTVGTLDKLSKTDRELLQKYSKVYFLNENYVPSNLAAVDPKYSYDKDKVLKVHAGITTHLQNMLDDAGRDPSTTLEIVSAYRSFGEQSSLKSNYKVVYGTGANKFSADQGYSEHQLGTALDFTTPKLSDSLTLSFEKTDAYKWLQDNAYKYGFVISYPRENTYYQFEPWHWRYVGVELATRLRDENIYFYAMDQREINQYLVKIFD